MQSPPLVGLQLGNEPGHFLTRNGYPSASQHGSDFAELKRLLSTMPQLSQLFIQGPDACSGEMTSNSPCADKAYIDELLQSSGGSIDQYTVHGYGMTGPKNGRPDDCDSASFLNASKWRGRMLPVLDQYLEIFQGATPLVLSETATTADGGCPDLSNAFSAGVFLIDELGFIAERAFYQVYRQDLVGFSGVTVNSSYALLGDPGWYSEKESGPLAPNPDYFTLLLYRSLMGAIYLPVNTRPKDELNSPENDKNALIMYAACLQGGVGEVVVSFANPDNATLSLSISIQQNLTLSSMHSNGSFVQAYFLTTACPSSPSPLKCRQILLNNSTLFPSSPLTPALVPAEAPILVPPFSYGFIVLPHGDASSCNNK